MSDDTRLFLNPKIYVADSKLHGRGVFTSEDLLPDEIIEQSHVIHPVNKSANNLDDTYRKYFFAWPFLNKNWKDYVNEYGFLPANLISYPACVLGFGMIYNHDRKSPNATVNINEEENFVEFRAARKILSGEEITICYNKSVDY
jgi:SET domain-containing protein